MCLCRCVRACVRACVCTCVSVCVCSDCLSNPRALALCSAEDFTNLSCPACHESGASTSVCVCCVMRLYAVLCVLCVSERVHTHTHTPTRMYLSPLSSSAALYSFSLCHPWMFAPACHAVDALRLCSWFSATGVRSGATVTATNTEQDTM